MVPPVRPENGAGSHEALFVMLNRQLSDVVVAHHHHFPFNRNAS